MDFFKPDVMLNSLIYSVLGVAVFWISFLIIDKITPYRLWEQLVERQNVALAIVVGSMSLGIAIIVASAIH